MPMHSQVEHSSWSSRPAFRPRQLLTAEQLNAGLEDDLLREHLVNRAMHGFGVVEGFGLTVGADGKLDLTKDCLELSGGLAFDRYGRMLFWKGGRVGIHDLVGRPPDTKGPYTLLAHYAARPPSDDECHPIAGPGALWRREGVAFSLHPGCHQVSRECTDHPPGSCISHDHYLARRTGGDPGDDPHDVQVSADLGWLLTEPGPPTCPAGPGHWYYDERTDVAVPLACLTIADLADPSAQPPCPPRYGFTDDRPRVDDVRPYAYRNPLLYELIRGCDVELPRIKSISWHDWIEQGWDHRVPWPDFAARISNPDEQLTIRFTRPIKVETLHSGSVFLTALTQEQDSDYWIPRRPPTRVHPLEENDGLAPAVRLEPTDDWLAAEVNGRRSSLFGGARFELTVRGQLLRDKCGRTLDARPVDIPSGERGQARPGDDFVAVFRVARRRRERDAAGPAASVADTGTPPAAPNPNEPESDG